jgi:hypothetical protein
LEKLSVMIVPAHELEAAREVAIRVADIRIRVADIRRGV